jgi:predicted nucleic acid-binding Zn ribbon protein
MFDPRKLADILTELHARRGYARVRTEESAEEAWREAVGEKLGPQTRVGPVRRGTLEVTVANSMVAQELQFQKQQILARLADLLPDEKIRDIRCKIGSVR